MAVRTFSDRLRRLRFRAREVQAAATTARTRAEAALLTLGLQPRRAEAGDVIDVDVGADRRHPLVGSVKRLARRTSQGLALAVGVVVLGLALWSLGIFVGAAALAFVVLTRGFGLRFDVGTPNTRPA